MLSQRNILQPLNTMRDQGSSGTYPKEVTVCIRQLVNPFWNGFNSKIKEVEPWEKDFRVSGG
jgi:hypothetical protein